jgi:predicted RNA-binding Zn ribbon-like protein
MIVETGTRAVTDGLVGGRLCLDFANTMHGRLSAEPRDDLSDYAGLVSWAKRARVLSAREAQVLQREAARQQKGARAVLLRAKILRDALYEIFSAVADKRTPPRSELAALNKELSNSLRHLQLSYREGGFVLGWAGETEALDRLLWPIAHSAQNLLTADELGAVKVCELEQCTWLFVDTSKNHSRRWCDMKGCGNRAKFRRYYERNRAAGVTSSSAR